MAIWGQKLWGHCAGPFLDQMQWNFKFGFEIPLCVPHKLFRMISYDPHSSVLDKIIFLKVTTKFIYNISKILNNQMKITTPSIIFKKKIPKIFSIIMRNEGWKLKKEWKIQATLSPFIPHPPLNLAMHHKNAWNFLWWYFLPKTRLLTKKIVQKSIYTGSGALALILAFVAVSNSSRLKMKKIRPLL